MREGQPGRKILRLGFEKTQKSTFETGRKDAKSAPFTHRHDLFRDIAVGINDRRLAWLEQPLEELEFGAQIFGKRCVIVEMVAREIGERRGAEANAVEPVLHNAMRGRLQGEMGDAAGREPIQGFVQTHRIRRGQRAGDRPRGRDDAKRAERGGFGAETRPNLTHEIGNGCLAARPGDRDDRLGLARVEARGRLRQGVPDVGGFNKSGRPGHAARIALGDDRNGAALNRLRRKGKAVGFCSRHREKNHVRHHPAAVGAEPLDLAGGQAVRNIRLGKQFGKAHQCSSPPFAGIFASA